LLIQEPKAPRAAHVGVAMLVTLTLVHALVDAFASSVQPLWPSFQRDLKLPDGSIQWVIIAWSLTTSTSQLFFGYLGDRHSGRWLLWAGPLLGIACMGCVGLANSVWTLGLLVVLGGLGVAAFHPEAAATAGLLVPEARSRSMSIFVTGGFLGQAIGPLGSGWISENYGLGRLTWNLAWGLGLLALLRPARLHVPHTSTHHSHPPVSISWLLTNRGRELAALMGAGLLRVLPAGGTPLALAFWLESMGKGNDVIGLNQSVFFLGIGLGGLGCALVARPSQERQLLWLLPLLAVPVLALIPNVGPGIVLLCSFGVGLTVGLGLPVFTSYGQLLLPEGQRIASSITMGVTWGLGGVIAPSLIAYCQRAGHIEWPFYAFALTALGAGFAGMALPRPRAIRPFTTLPDGELSAETL
jgi:MFS transporter, FSR family, fosmidomycin resistance protein